MNDWLEVANKRARLKRKSKDELATMVLELQERIDIALRIIDERLP